MSKKYKRLKTTTNSREYKSIRRYVDHYWDECIAFYPRHNRGTNTVMPKLMKFQVRMYRTWKHNRKTQWKSIEFF